MTNEKQEVPGARQIDNNFKYHSPTELQIEQHVAIQEIAKSFAHFINEICPDSIEKRLAITNLEQAVMWGNAAIVRNEQE